MFGFLIKKSFFDAWDNIFLIILINLAGIAALAVMILLPTGLAAGSAAAAAALSLPGLILLHLYAGTASYMLNSLSESGTLQLSDFLPGLKKTWKASILLSVLSIILFTVFFISFNFYFSGGNFLSLLGAGIIFWVSLLWVLTCQNFFPVLIKLEDNLFVSLKKSALIALDNPLYSILVLLTSLFLLIVSVILLFLLPGLSGILLLHQNAVKLRLYKYDWLEKNSRSAKIPWKDLLKEDNEKLGHRSLKGMIFPWKD